MLHRLTGIDPKFVHTREGLQRFVDQYLQTYRTDSPEIRMVKVLLRKYMVT